jgi:hypothetical protein
MEPAATVEAFDLLSLDNQTGTKVHKLKPFAKKTNLKVSFPAPSQSRHPPSSRAEAEPRPSIPRRISFLWAVIKKMGKVWEPICKCGADAAQMRPRPTGRYFMGKPKSPVKYRQGSPKPTTLRPSGSQPMAGLMTAGELAAY